MRYVAKQTVPQAILDAGDWAAERLGITRRQVFRLYRAPSLPAAHAADNMSLAVEVEPTENVEN